MDKLTTAPAFSQFLCEQWEKNIEASIRKSHEGHLGAFAPVSFIVYHLIAIEGVIETVTRLALGVLLIGFAFCVSDHNFIEYFDKQFCFLNPESKLFIAAKFTSYAICVPWQRLISFFSNNTLQHRSPAQCEAPILRSPPPALVQSSSDRSPGGLPPTVPARGVLSDSTRGIDTGDVARFGIRGAARQLGGGHLDPATPPSPHARGDSLPGGNVPTPEALQAALLEGIGGGSHTRQATAASEVSFVSEVSDDGSPRGEHRLGPSGVLNYDALQ